MVTSWVLLFASRLSAQIRADRRQREVNLRAELPPARFAAGNGTGVGLSQFTSSRSLRPSPSMSRTCTGLDAAGERNLLRLAQRVVFLLCEEINAILAQQNQVGAAIAVQVARDKRIGGKLAVLDGPAFGRAPAVCALVVKHDQFLRLAVIGDVGPAVAVEVGHHQRGDAFLRGDGLDAKPRVGRQFVRLALDRGLSVAARLVLPVWL